jgi:hypothetical protein
MANPSSGDCVGGAADVLPGEQLCTDAIGSESDTSGAISLDSTAGAASGAALAGVDAGGIGVLATGDADDDQTRR